MVDQPGLHRRHRNQDGEISRKHGNTRVSTLRRIYGTKFLRAASPRMQSSPTYSLPWTNRR
jgi:hypothetical protein